MSGYASFALALLMLGLVGCSGGEPASSAPPTTASESRRPEPDTSTEGADDAPTELAAAQGSASPEGPADPPAPEGPPVDLLRATTTRVHVSSVFEDDGARARQVADGRLETAWNSRTGDLVGAFIDIELPAAARIQAIDMTVGFTRPGRRTDLFTGNHRVSSVRVARDGQVLGTYPLDVGSRALQTVPVIGPGGTYRIEIAEVVPGSREDWREVCISELRVMGSLEGASAGSTQPRFGVGALPGAAITAGPATDATAVDATATDATAPTAPTGEPAGPPELASLRLEIDALRYDIEIDSESFTRGRRSITFPTLTHPTAAVRAALNRLLRAGSLAAVEEVSPARFGLEIDSACDPLLVTDVLVSVVCATTEYEDAGNTERVSAFHLEVVGGRVRDAALTGFFVDGTTLEDLLASVPSTQRARHMSCTGDCDAYAAALGDAGVVLVDETGDPFYTIPYETLRPRLRGEGTLATLFARTVGDEQ